MSEIYQNPEQALKSVFGYDSFRLTQREIITRTLSGADSLVIMPTGGGKSLCYQIPALLKAGFALVISPLIALMKDQVGALQSNGVCAEALNSTCSATKEQAIFNDIVSQRLKLLYVSPEKAVSASFMQFLKGQKLSLIAIDEAHCVSIWGNDFRPEYTQLHYLVSEFPQVPHLALTATADKATQNDIVEQLKLRKPRKFLSSFERKNLSINVLPSQKRYEKIKFFINKQKTPGAGIIYCLSRRNAEKIAEKLQSDGIISAHYHAGMPAKARSKVQEAFLRDEIQIICATIAFGMGVDKPNIRWVIHYNMPKNLESYYQEIGRAGRDGQHSRTLIFQGYGDYQTLRSFIIESNGSETFKQVQLAKLNRMRDYLQASSCRTNLILNYFGEFKNEPCGRCDICLHPPKLFDGTILAQKALSALKRLKSGVTLPTLVDVLRGSGKREILEKGYHHIKTYGAGRDTGYVEWIQYLTQMVNQGILEVDYVRQHRLLVTAKGEEILFKNKKIALSLAVPFKEKQAKTEIRKTEKNENTTENDLLFNLLKQKRSEIAKEEGVPPYVVFSDKTLREIAAHRPKNNAEMFDIFGVGQVKLKKYGNTFIDLVGEFDEAKF